MTADKLKQKLIMLRNDFKYYCQHNLKIRTKAGKIEPLMLNKAQLYIHERLEQQYKSIGKIRALVLKGRQQGCSTYTEARFYWRVTFRRGVRAFILTHEDEATKNLFEMAQRYHEHSTAKPSTKASNAKELEFDKLDSGYRVGTAGNKSVGRSNTIQYFHGSEVAFWPHADEHAKGVMQAIADLPETEVILESTANGLGNYFHAQWQLAEAGQSEYIAIFVPWYWQDEYRKPVSDGFQPTDREIELVDLYGLSNEQLVFRRTKIQELSASGIDGEKAFMQEYPCSAIEAFQTTGGDSFITPDLVMRARKGKPEPVGPIVLGVDPARFGADRTSMIFRCGRMAYGMKSYEKKDTMEVAGLVHKLITEQPPGHPISRVFIDVGGLGAGVVDRLKEMGYGKFIVPVNSGETPLDAERYVNKRAEMWSEMKKWLMDYPCQIPDADSLHADLCAPTYKFDSKTRVVLEKKEDMKARGMRSPDEGDALALTFAFPVRPENIAVQPRRGVADYSMLG
jgi:hypothetical protein